LLIFGVLTPPAVERLSLKQTNKAQQTLTKTAGSPGGFFISVSSTRSSP